jgi:hypothetical protein
MQPLPIAVVACPFGGTLLFSLLFDPIKVPVSEALQIAQRLFGRQYGTQGLEHFRQGNLRCPDSMVTGKHHIAYETFSIKSVCEEAALSFP